MKTVEKEVFLARFIPIGDESIFGFDPSKNDDNYILLGKGTATIELIDQDENEERE